LVELKNLRTLSVVVVALAQMRLSDQKNSAVLEDYDRKMKPESDQTRILDWCGVWNVIFWETTEHRMKEMTSKAVVGQT
jgi:hypothetical protein